MPHEFLLPDIGEGLTDAEIVEWHVSPGDEVLVDQPIVDIETAKATVEITSIHSGTILSLAGPPGATINVGDVLFVVGHAEESAVPPLHDPVGSKTHLSPEKAQRGTIREHGRAMPIVRRLAFRRGIDLATVQGSGPDGIVTRQDIDNASSAEATAERVSLSRRRKAIAEHMTESWTTIPHVTVQADMRAESLLAARERQEAGAIPVEVLVAVAVLPLLERYREFNAVIRGDAVEFRSRYNLGFALDAEAGLLVVVVHEADQLSPDELVGEFSRLAQAAHDGTLTPTETTGQTFTISNIGALGGGHGTPIIPVGTSAILSIGRAKAAPVVEAGSIEVGLVAPIDLSYDHRLIDGALGQKFLAALVSNLETIGDLLT